MILQPNYAINVEFEKNQRLFVVVGGEMTEVTDTFSIYIEILNHINCLLL